MEKKCITAFCVLFFITFCFSGSVFANALDNNSIGVRGMAMCSANTGIVNDATAIYYNPGGLTSIKADTLNIDANGLFIFPNYKYEEPGGDEYISTKQIIIPGLHTAYSLDSLGFGIALHIPYGGGGVLFEDYPVGYDFESYVALAALSPSIAYKILPNLSAGLTLSVYYGMLTLKALDQNFGEVDLETSGIAGYGGNLGIMFKASDEMSIGISIKSKVDVEMEGILKAFGSENDANVSFTLPWYYIIGMGYKITPELLISADFWYLQYSTMDERKLKVELGGVTLEEKQKTYYNDGITAMVGIEYNAMPELDIRGGIKFEQGMLDNEHITVDRIMDSDRYTFSLGSGYHVNENIELGLVLAYAYAKEEISSGENKGTYSQNHMSITVGIRANI